MSIATSGASHEHRYVVAWTPPKSIRYPTGPRKTSRPLAWIGRLRRNQSGRPWIGPRALTSRVSRPI